MGEVVYVALGSNLGDRHAALAHARRGLAALPGTRVTGESPVEELAALGADWRALRALAGVAA